jgi:diguanylate cyclase (GGDEF)-like protein
MPVTDSPASLPPAVSPHAEADRPSSELDRLEQLGRTQPAVAAAQLVAYAATLAPADPRFLEALTEAGSQYVNAAMGDSVEQIARRIESLSGTVPLARPAAMILRGHWLVKHGEPSHAERQLIEANALLPAEVPLYLRLRLLGCWGEAKGRAGRYDEAMKRYNVALRLADESAPVWRRIDMRIDAATVLIDAMQLEKVSEMEHEAMRLALESGDEYGLARAWTDRAIVLTSGPDSAATLAAWRAALEHARLSGSKQATVLSMANIADYYLKHGDYDTAYETSMRALPLAHEAHNDSAESVALANAGLALISTKRKDEGVPLVRNSMTMDEHSGSARNVADTVNELGVYLEKAGYLADAMAAYHQYRRLADDLNQQDRQRALVELQEGFANERRQHELDMLSREGRLKDEELLHHDLEMKEWTAAGLSSLLLLAVVASLARRLRVRNQQLSVSNEQLRQQAEIDPLTGLSNRHHLLSAMARRPSRSLEGTLFLIDVDHFKQINDRFGHAGGDAVLVEVSRRLRATLRDADLVVRWGGEEFLVLVRPLPRAEADVLAHRLLCALADPPVVHEGEAVSISASIGYGVFPMAQGVALDKDPGDVRPDLPVDWERAIAVVDSAMYLAKAHGRNGACGVVRVNLQGATGLDDAIHSLEAACQDGRVELTLQHGPVVGSPSNGRAGRAARGASSRPAESDRRETEMLS